MPVLIVGSNEIAGGSSESTEESEVGLDQSMASLWERVTEILGYDLFASEAEGYAEMAEESLRLAESNLAASVETLPSE